MSDQIETDHKSLPNAGKYIGIIERLFVLIFIVIGRWEVIGLLIAAKSVFRFNDLKERNNRKLTEYILIGTLVSFGLAILAGLFYIS
jgi:cytochrome c biogenesis protein CcdA